MNNYAVTCEGSSDCVEYSTCNARTNSCECDSGYQYGEDKCKQCPGPSSQCTSCCYPPNRYRCVGNHCVCWNNCNDSFVLAAQVALGSALTIAFLALAALFWKTCPHRSGSNGRLSSLLREQESSLTSMQRFILQRLRDRPPRYEDNSQIRLEKPPPYQETITDFEVPDTWGISPPLYSEAVVTPACSIPADENKPFQQTNISTVCECDTRTQMEDGNRQRVEAILSGHNQLDSANSSRLTVHEMRQTQHSNIELHM